MERSPLFVQRVEVVDCAAHWHAISMAGALDLLSIRGFARECLGFMQFSDSANLASSPSGIDDQGNNSIGSQFPVVERRLRQTGPGLSARYKNAGAERVDAAM